MMGLVKNTLAGIVLVLALSGCSDESKGNLSAPEAFELVQNNKITLVDIRRPDEWRQTGTAQGVKTINMLHPQGMTGFAQALDQAVGGDRSAPIVLICRTGNRSSRLAPALAELGFTNVRHVPEGMVGSSHGPGWIARGLPVEPCKQC